MDMVEIHKLKGSFYDGNVYLIKAKEAMLVDAGTDARAVINQIKRTTSNLKYIVLTHYHYDHSLAAGEVAAATNAEILIHEEDIELLQDVILTLIEVREIKMKIKMKIKPLKGGRNP
jgi:hydroxyacylglutathione hydrolase